MSRNDWPHRRVERPDWLQKWQSSGQPPVLAERMPSTSTSGRTTQPDLVGQRQQLFELVVRCPQHVEDLLVRQGFTALEDLLASDLEDVGTDGCLSSHGWSLAQR